MSKLGSKTPIHILLVEDNDNDIELTKIAFHGTGYDITLHSVTNGEECLAFLRREGCYSDAPAPDLVLLDLNMPRMGGRETLVEIRRDERLRHLPVVVVSSSESEADANSAWQCGCSSYVVKPLGFENFANATKLMADYWFSLVRLPGKK